MECIRSFHYDLLDMGRQNKRFLPIFIWTNWVLMGTLCFLCLNNCSNCQILAVTTLTIDDDMWNNSTESIEATSKITIVPGMEHQEKYHSPTLGYLLSFFLTLVRGLVDLLCKIGSFLLWILKAKHSVLRGLEWFFRCGTEVIIFISAILNVYHLFPS